MDTVARSFLESLAALVKGGIDGDVNDAKKSGAATLSIRLDMLDKHGLFVLLNSNRMPLIVVDMVRDLYAAEGMTVDVTETEMVFRFGDRSRGN